MICYTLEIYYDNYNLTKLENGRFISLAVAGFAFAKPNLGSYLHLYSGYKLIIIYLPKKLLDVVAVLVAPQSPLLVPKLKPPSPPRPVLVVVVVVAPNAGTKKF